MYGVNEYGNMIEWCSLQSEAPQGCLLFSLYTSPIGNVDSNFNISLQQYMDDTTWTATNSLESSLYRIELCLATLHSWFFNSGLTLNSNKTEAIIFGT